ncbi:MAG: signal peptidase I [Anaerosomatales bacterium]|nr:signal peptidase I [Anaerosomatales bacterium]MDT8434861.1 signal peptidase I [Anaerosomatales bacterium]
MTLRSLALPFAALFIACVTHGIVVVTGGSMEPALRAGDVCVYRRSADVRPGQMVVFERDGAGLVVHRAVTVGLHGEVRSKGDANETADREEVPRDRVRGPVTLALPVGRLVNR